MELSSSPSLSSSCQQQQSIIQCYLYSWHTFYGLIKTIYSPYRYDIQATDKFTLNIDLWVGRPVGVLFQTLPNLRNTKRVPFLLWQSSQWHTCIAWIYVVIPFPLSCRQMGYMQQLTENFTIHQSKFFSPLVEMVSVGWKWHCYHDTCLTMATQWTFP